MQEVNKMGLTRLKFNYIVNVMTELYVKQTDWIVIKLRKDVVVQVKLTSLFTSQTVTFVSLIAVVLQI